MSSAHNPSSRYPFEEGRLLSGLCTWEIGGPARWFIEVHTIQHLQDVLRLCLLEKIPFFVLGKGSNTLFDDQGYPGLVLANRIHFCEAEAGALHVGAGYSFSLLGTQTARGGWGGLEFASGIPGSVGGAVYMNAGASGSEVSRVLTEVTYVTPEGAVEVYPRDALTFSYRTSPFQSRQGVIASARFQLTSSDEARAQQKKLIAYRTSTQPYADPSAGCVFRNPPQRSAGALIEQCGLKGMRVGGAEVSTQHANFVVNRGGATARDVRELIQLIQRTVLEKTGVHLEMEVRTVPS
jgi:UDP-N-acetylmuramate dehydrogenase